jgi:hypothetical protein
MEFSLGNYRLLWTFTDLEKVVPSIDGLTSAQRGPGSYTMKICEPIVKINKRSFQTYLDLEMMRYLPSIIRLFFKQGARGAC